MWPEGHKGGEISENDSGASGAITCYQERQSRGCALCQTPAALPCPCAAVGAAHPCVWNTHRRLEVASPGAPRAGAAAGTSCVCVWLRELPVLPPPLCPISGVLPAPIWHQG